MKIRKIIAVLLSLSVMICILCSCGEKETDYPTLPPPKDKWSTEKIMSVTYIGGNKMSYPPKWGDFKKNVKINREKCREEEGYVVVNLYYKPSYELCSLLFYDQVDKVKELKDDTPIEMIILERENPIISKQMSINGVRFNDSKEDVKQKLGEPSIDINDDRLTYYLNDSDSLFLEFYKDKLYRASYWLNYDKNK